MSGELPFDFFMENIIKAQSLTFFGLDVTEMTRADLMAAVAFLAVRVPGYDRAHSHGMDLSGLPRPQPSSPVGDIASGYTITVIGGNL